MKTMILGLLAETSIHPGAGQEIGFVDLPVAREGATDYPVIVGSSFKGALLDRARSGMDDPTRNRIFGQQDNAGSVLVSDARLVLLPVRSLASHYKWITCPHLLERLTRDLKRVGHVEPTIAVTGPARGRYLGIDDGPLFLEERQFDRGGDLPDGLVKAIEPLIRHEETRKRLSDQLVVLHDDDFVWFARFGLAVNVRNQLDKVTKTSQNLWYEETIPPDSVFYCLLADRNGGDSLDAICKLFEQHPYIQVGGNETVGQGWFAVEWLKGGAA